MKRTVAVLALVIAAGVAFGNGRAAEASQVAAVEHVVKMTLSDGKYRFEPAEVRAKAGDRITFVLVSGAPHNVAFDGEQIADAAEAALSKVLPERIAPLAGPLLTAEGAKYTVSLEGVAPGRYPFFCMPHVSMNMNGVLVVE